MKALVSLLLAIVVVVIAPGARAEEAGFVLFGGAIHDGGAAGPQALVAREGRIVFVGALEEARRQGAGLRQIDLKGAHAYPGLTDSHVHLTGVGLREMTLNLDQTRSVADLVAAVGAWNTAHPGPEPLTGRGWIETHWPEKRFPNRADLDKVSTVRPIVLQRADGHALVANSAALARAGISRATPDPAGGRIERDAAGEPTGMLIDNAMGLMAARLPPLSPALRREALKRAVDHYASLGWTHAVNMSTEAADLEALEALAAAGQLPIRVDVFMTPEDAGPVLARGPYADPTGLVRVRGVKLYMDGALGSRGAALLAPYSDRPDTAGLLIAEHDPTLAILKQALKVRAQVAIHAIGDRGNRLALDWIEEAFASDPEAAAEVRAQAPWRIEHAQIIDPADIPRFAALGVVASMQPSHAIGDLYFAPARLGPDRLAGAYAWKSLVATHAYVVGGSDAPVEVGDPRIEYYAAVARKDLHGRSGPDWGPDQALDRRAALALFTREAGAAVGYPLLGQLRPGAPADLTVLSRDILSAPEADILTTRPLMTIVSGRVTFDGR